ncbi:MAG: hypothetical protein D8H92_07870 [Campylobacter sp.]|nr:MAG: hypothetical protein D8H92_07870 [Campylobacter sp.]
MFALLNQNLLKVPALRNFIARMCCKICERWAQSHMPCSFAKERAVASAKCNSYQDERKVKRARGIVAK